jgi:pimeloyl-ACP methyl ester carboxylesterase
VVLSPGVGDLRAAYRFVAPALAEAGYRVVAPDLRGMGDSSPAWDDYSETGIASDLDALIGALDGGPAILVGNSISAGAAVCLAATSPSRVRALVLVGPFVRNIPVPAWKSAMFRLALARPWGASTWVRYQRDRLYPKAKPPDSAERSRALRANLAEPGRMRAFQRMVWSDHRAAEAALPRVAVPVLVVIGGADPDFSDPAGEGRWVAEHVHGKLVVIPGVGHYPQAEAPREFLDAVRPFIDREGHGA